MSTYRRFFKSLPAALLAVASVTCGGDNLVLPKEGEPANAVVIHGNNQNGTVGMVLAESLIVRITDTKTRPVVGARVLFSLGTNPTGADLVPDTAITDADGQARARWFLGTVSGVQTVQARVIGFNQVTATITATAAAGPADTLVVVNGAGQSGTVGQSLAESLVVRVNDAFGNPVSGVSVGWTVSGGGSVSPITVVTGTNGQAATERVLGVSAGPQSATATVAGLNGSPIVFAHTAVAGGPTALLKIAGDNQTAPAGTFLAESLQVRLVDGSGNGVSGRSVSFTPSPSNGTTSPTSVVTDVNGFASSRWTLGATATGQSLITAAVGFSATFNATATSDVPTAIAINGGNNQTATAGTAVAIDPSVRVRDANNNGVGNVSVTFTVTAGGGTVTGPSGSGSSTIVASNSQGIATLTSWVLGGTAGTNTLTATATGPGGVLQGSPLTFTATGNPGSASQLTITTQPPATAASGATFGTTPVVQVRDAGGNPVNTAGINVTVSLGTGTGTLNGTRTVPTNASGQALFGGLSITGLAGAYTLDFTSGALTGATSSTINLTAGAATRLALTTQPSSSAQSGVAFPQQPVVQLEDAAGNNVSQSGVVVTALIATGGGTLNGTLTATTNGSGAASFTNLAITGAAGGRTLDFTASGLTKATSVVVTIGAGGATRLALGAQPTTTAAGAVISPAVTVLVQDASGNTVAGANNSITIALAANSGGSILAGTLTVNAVNGVATFADLSLDKVGTGYTLAATATGLTGATSNAFNVTPRLSSPSGDDSGCALSSVVEHYVHTVFKIS
ncbi:MAG: Ig-like domain-containing protein [Gemmatimonadota bacterium]